MSNIDLTCAKSKNWHVTIQFLCSLVSPLSLYRTDGVEILSLILFWYWPIHVVFFHKNVVQKLASNARSDFGIHLTPPLSSYFQSLLRKQNWAAGLPIFRFLHNADSESGVVEKNRLIGMFICSNVSCKAGYIYLLLSACVHEGCLVCCAHLWKLKLHVH